MTLAMEPQVSQDPTRFCTLLGSGGDVTIGWDESQDEEMRALIEKKMTEGVTFFIVEPTKKGIWKRRRKIKDGDDLDSLEERKVRIGDSDFAAMFDAGEVSVTKTDGQINMTKRAKTASEVVDAKESVAIRPVAGG